MEKATVSEAAVSKQEVVAGGLIIQSDNVRSRWIADDPQILRTLILRRLVSVSWASPPDMEKIRPSP